jgi:hypothetical protein
MTNNQPQSALNQRRAKFQWRGEDDDKQSFVEQPADKDGKYALEPMRIRSFVIQYDTST